MYPSKNNDKNSKGSLISIYECMRKKRLAH